MRRICSRFRLQIASVAQGRSSQVAAPARLYIGLAYGALKRCDAEFELSGSIGSHGFTWLCVNTCDTL